MSVTLAWPAEFSRVSALFDGLIRQIESDVDEFRRASAEAAHSCSERLSATWSEWPVRRAEFAAAIENLPRELRKHDFVKNAMHEMERFERNAKAFMAEASNALNEAISHPHVETCRESYTAFTASWHARSVALQEHAAALSVKMDELISHPLTQKFMRGETILSDRAHIQWARKIGHMVNGLFFLWIFEFSGIERTLAWKLTAAFALWAGGLETLRHMNPRVNDWVCKAFRPVMREREKNKVNSAIFFMLAMVFVYLVFPRDVAVLSMLFIAVGDPVAGVIGVYFGKRKLSEHSSLEGTLACFTACAALAFVAAAFFFDSFRMAPLTALAFAIPAGLVGAFAEGSFKNLDDNLVMPLLSAPGLWLLLRFFA
jgi:dolichol kinase